MGLIKFVIHRMYYRGLINIGIRGGVFCRLEGLIIVLYINKI